jgi:hypothetical protein
MSAKAIVRSARVRRLKREANDKDRTHGTGRALFVSLRTAPGDSPGNVHATRAIEHADQGSSADGKYYTGQSLRVQHRLPAALDRSIIGRPQN